MPTTQVKLWFKSLQDLWHFAQCIAANPVEINTRELSLLCECQQTDIALAVEVFGATTFAHQKAGA